MAALKPDAADLGRDIVAGRPVAVVMGVAGSGKSTIGLALADRLGVPFRDADEFHPQANIDKQVAGHPLDDHDRRPWLEAISAWLAERRGEGGIVTCSALKRQYRDLLRRHDPELAMLHLVGPREVAHDRVASRRGHFMPPSLVDSQYDTLQELAEDEPGMVADFTRSVDEVVDAFAAFLVGFPVEPAEEDVHRPREPSADRPAAGHTQHGA